MKLMQTELYYLLFKTVQLQFITLLFVTYSKHIVQPFRLKFLTIYCDAILYFIFFAKKTLHIKHTQI